jgi:hypothetical protein
MPVFVLSIKTQLKVPLLYLLTTVADDMCCAATVPRLVRSVPDLAVVCLDDADAPHSVVPYSCTQPKASCAAG